MEIYYSCVTHSSKEYILLKIIFENAIRKWGGGATYLKWAGNFPKMELAAPLQLSKWKGRN